MTAALHKRIAVLVVAGALVYGCPRGGPGDPCTQASDCQRNLVCDAVRLVCVGGIDAAAIDASGGTDGGGGDAACDDAGTDAGTDAAGIDAGGTDAGVPSGWTPVPSAGALSPRAWATAVWTGTEVIVWGGTDPGPSGSPVPTSTGARYDPASDTWAPTSPVDAPSQRLGHAAVWTGAEMIVWGGADHDGTSFLPLDTGARYDPVNDSWTATSLVGAHVAVAFPVYVWTGTELIVWSGGITNGSFAGLIAVPGGARYDPVSDSWFPVSNTGAASARWFNSGVWTGSEMLVWGGFANSVGSVVGNGGTYDPVADVWSPPLFIAPVPPRGGHAALWSGSELVIWGGTDYVFNTFGDGATYTPGGSWSSLSAIGAPVPGRWHSAAVWSGTRAIVWSGMLLTAVSFDVQPGGALYDPVADAWMPMTVVGEPAPRYAAATTWTGTSMFVFGGFGQNALGNFVTYGDGALYVP